METSDSECFESADEEFASDNDGENCKLAPALPKHTPPETVKLEKLSIIEDTKLSITKHDNVSSENESSKINQIKNNSSSAEGATSNLTASSTTVKSVVNKTERKSKPPRSTLGVKLVNKKVKSDFHLRSDGKDLSKIKSKCDFEPVEHVKIIDNVDRTYQTDSIVKSEPIRDESKNYDAQFKNNAIFNNSKIKCQDKGVNMWENDDWEPVENVSNKLVEEVQNKNENETITDQFRKTNEDNLSSNWTGWGNWGVTSLLSTSTMGVTSITNHVSQGLTTVLESGIGVPNPEELARLHKVDKNVQESDIENKNTNTGNLDSTFGLGSFVSGVTQITKLVETTGNKVISSGLDTLETIGKKTMEVLQEGDPGLKKKRAFLKIETDKPVLSQILREAKQKAEYENKLAEEKHYCKKANYETLFDDHQGLVHLEALEMLSKQCDIKLQTLLESHNGSDLIEMQETMGQIKELCELTEDDDENLHTLLEIKEKLDTATADMNIPISYSKLISTWIEAEQWLDNLNLNICNEMELHEQSINILAQLTAIAVELFHKTGELLLIKEHRSTVDEADSLVQLTGTITILISNVAKKVADKLHEKASSFTNKDNINGLITNVHFEATNSSSYVKDAFHLLIPVLQVGAV